MDPAAQVPMGVIGGSRANAARRRVHPGLQIVEATLDHWEILLGDPKVCMRI
jgi:hypothetical protein